MTFSYVLARPEHIERMRDIEVDAGELFRTIGLDSIADDEPPGVELLLSHIASSTAWVAIDTAGTPVGYITASIVDDEGHIDQVSVAREASGRRVGSALINVVVEWCRSESLSTLTLTTFRDVPWNGPYYERLGFVPLSASECGPELLQILRDEHDSGIAVLPRIAMRLTLQA